MLFRMTSGYRRFLARQEHGVDVFEITAMAMPEIADLRFQVDQFDTVRKTMVHMFDMLVMDPVALDESRLYAVKERLVDTGELGVGKQVARHAGTGHAVPQPGRARLCRMMKIETQRDQLAHDG